MIPLPPVDSHLDLAENAILFGRDLTLSTAEIRRLENRSNRQATVSLPELERDGVTVVFAKVTPGFLAAEVGTDFEPSSAIYHTPEEAEAQALAQVTLYERWDKQGRVRLLRSVTDLDIPRVCASHANAQALTPTDRHQSDTVICAIARPGCNWPGPLQCLSRAALEAGPIHPGYARTTPALPPEARERVLSTNWLRFLRSVLPMSA